MDRRSALLGLGSIGLAGCCSLRPFPKEEIGDGSSRGLTAFLEPLSAPLGRRALVRAIDVHAHFFNASDVNVAGFLEHSVAHSMKEPLRSFLKLMAPIVDELAGTVRTARQEYEGLLSMQAGFGPADRGAVEAQLDALTGKRRDEIARDLVSEMRRRGVDRVYLDLRARAYARGAVPPDAQDFAALIRAAIEPPSGPDKGLGPRSEGSLDPDGVIEFVGLMLHERWMVLRTYRRAHSEDAAAFGISAAFSALVDFDYWLDCPARSGRRDQMKLHSLMSRLSGGYMLPLFGYNPWTDLERSGESFRNLQDAVLEYGFIGVKIYPAMGFFPYGNAKLSLPSDMPRPKDLAKLDAALAEVFDWCAAQGVPVMSHTGESMGRDTPSDRFGGPAGWSALLDRYAQSGRGPIVNLGHFGGDSRNTDAPDKQWPTEFARLMARPEGRHLYGDLGYWTDLRSCVASSPCSALERIRNAKAAFPGTDDRLMFGTDWHMTSKERDWPSYPGDLARALQGTIDLDKVFWRNAAGCFGLARGGAQRARIERHLQGKLPAWMQNI